MFCPMCGDRMSELVFGEYHCDNCGHVVFPKSIDDWLKNFDSKMDNDVLCSHGYPVDEPCERCSVSNEDYDGDSETF